MSDPNPINLVTLANAAHAAAAPVAKPAVPRRMVPGCACSHTLREHYGGSRRWVDANACRLRTCSCRMFRDCCVGAKNGAHAWSCLQTASGRAFAAAPSFAPGSLPALARHSHMALPAFYAAVADARLPSASPIVSASSFPSASPITSAAPGVW